MPDETQNSNPFAPPSNDSGGGESISLGLVEGEEFETDIAKAMGLPTNGVYPCRCVAIKRGKSRADNDMLTVTYAIVSGEFAGSEIMDWVLYNEKNAFKILCIYRAFGIDTKGTVSVDAYAFIGKNVNVKLKQDKDRDGQPQCRVVHPVMVHEAVESEPFRNEEAPATDTSEDDIPF